MNNVKSPVFQSISDTARVTGLSVYYLRKLLKEGRLPHFRVGQKVYVDTEKFIAQLREEETTG